MSDYLTHFSFLNRLDFEIAVVHLRKVHTSPISSIGTVLECISSGNLDILTQARQSHQLFNNGSRTRLRLTCERCFCQQLSDCFWDQAVVTGVRFFFLNGLKFLCRSVLEGQTNNMSAPLWCILFLHRIFWGFSFISTDESKVLAFF